MDIDSETGEYLVSTARIAVEEIVIRQKRIDVPSDAPQGLNTKAGTFVTLKYNNGIIKELRGCIGIPLPEQSLISSLLESAISAATIDPRFLPVKPEELKKITLEISILTPPELIDSENRRKLSNQISIGTHGLIVNWSMGSGLLLPQVAIDEGWDAREFLSQACLKAGGMPDLWLLPDTRIQIFEAIVFEELEPYGKIVRRSVV